MRFIIGCGMAPPTDRENGSPTREKNHAAAVDDRCDGSRFHWMLCRRSAPYEPTNMVSPDLLTLSQRSPLHLPFPFQQNLSPNPYQTRQSSSLRWEFRFSVGTQGSTLTNLQQGDLSLTSQHFKQNLRPYSRKEAGQEQPNQVEHKRLEDLENPPHQPPGLRFASNQKRIKAYVVLCV